MCSILKILPPFVKSISFFKARTKEGKFGQVQKEPLKQPDVFICMTSTNYIPTLPTFSLKGLDEEKTIIVMITHFYL